MKNFEIENCKESKKVIKLVEENDCIYLRIGRCSVLRISDDKCTIWADDLTKFGIPATIYGDHDE